MPYGTNRPDIFVAMRMLTFPQFFQFGDECLQTASEVTVVLPELLSVAVERDNGGKADDLVLLRQLVVLLSQLGTLGCRARIIEFYQHQIISCIFLELRSRQNISIEFNTPTTPV